MSIPLSVYALSSSLFFRIPNAVSCFQLMDSLAECFARIQVLKCCVCVVPAQFCGDDTSELADKESEDGIKTFAELLGLQSDDVVEVLTTRKIEARDMSVRKPVTPEEACDCCSSCADVGRRFQNLTVLRRFSGCCYHRHLNILFVFLIVCCFACIFTECEAIHCFTPDCHPVHAFACAPLLIVSAYHVVLLLRLRCDRRCKLAMRCHAMCTARCSTGLCSAPTSSLARQNRDTHPLVR